MSHNHVDLRTGYRMMEQRYIVLLYKTNKFSGTLRSSEEGHVFWLDRKDLDDANFIWDMRELMEIFETDQYSGILF